MHRESGRGASYSLARRANAELSSDRACSIARTGCGSPLMRVTKTISPSVVGLLYGEARTAIVPDP